MSLSTSGVTRRRLPHAAAVFSDDFVFTTLSPTDIATHGKSPYCHPNTGKPVHIFCLDDEVDYISFAQDYGPLNLAFTFKACLILHEKMRLMVCHRDPSDAFAPISHMEIRPFRDAGNGPMDFGLTIQDILWGVHKAVQLDLLCLSEFDPQYYQYYETVDNGDLNVLGSFIPFASPMDPLWIQQSRQRKSSPRSPGDSETSQALEAREQTDRATAQLINTAMNRTHAFECVLRVFSEEKVGLVVRLNEDLYDRQSFLDRGMEHVDLYFDDGSNPSDEIVQSFIQMAERVIEGDGKKVAVHCKAGLGRTGVLIGAYLIYKYQFTAPEVIGYMRLVRPGMVVGPQQQYMMSNQMKWAGWAAQDRIVKQMARHSLEPINPLATPPMDCDEPLQPLDIPSRLETTMGEHGTIKLASSRLVATLSEDVQMTSTYQPDVTGPKHPGNKGGDAVGQPRKSPTRPIRGEEYVPAATHDPPTDTGGGATVDTPVEIRLRTASPTDPNDSGSHSRVASGGSMRGIKRAATRVPVSSSRGTSPSVTPPDHGLAIPNSLIRSESSSSLASSVNSIASANERPTKRRPERPEYYSSPLSSSKISGTSKSSGQSEVASTGLSSPPPSRESSPAVSDRPVGQNALQSSVEGTPKSSSSSRLPNKLRRKVTPTPPTRTESAPNPASVTSPRQLSPPTSAIPRPTTSMKSQQQGRREGRDENREGDQDRNGDHRVTRATSEDVPVLTTRKSLLPIRRVAAAQASSSGTKSGKQAKEELKSEMTSRQTRARTQDYDLPRGNATSTSNHRIINTDSSRSINPVPTGTGTGIAAPRPRRPKDHPQLNIQMERHAAAATAGAGTGPTGSTSPRSSPDRFQVQRSPPRMTESDKAKLKSGRRMGMGMGMGMNLTPPRFPKGLGFMSRMGSSGSVSTSGSSGRS